MTDAGAKTSHTAIVARALEIPAVVGLGRITSLVERGDSIIVDGSRGVVVINPTPGERSDYEAARERYRLVEEELLRTRDLPARTLDDVIVRLAGNIEFLEEIPSLLEHGGEAIGLYRTEFLFLNRADLPTEEEHYGNYRDVLEALAPRPVTIRTFDLGGDKLPAGMRVHAENPALGLRAIRFCLRQPELFKTQLRALLRASVHGNLKIMFPMISGVAELRRRAGPSRRCAASSQRARRAVEGGPPGRHHDRAAVGGDDRRPARARVRLLLHRDERPHPVHDGHRPREQARGLPLQAAAPRGPADARHHLRRPGARRGSRSRCAARWRASR